MAMTRVARVTRSLRWASVAAWTLSALAVVGLSLTAWLDHLSRLAGRPDLAQLAGGSVVPPVAALAALSFVMLLTPTGSLPSARWRWWARVAMAALVVVLFAVVTSSGPLDPR